jgi:hypothetical protein
MAGGRMTGLSRNGNAALAYVRQLHWAVFPLHAPAGAGCSCGNPDCDSIGKHPRISGGFKGATLNPEQVCRWWQQWPDANIGIATGAVSGIVVIDLDGHVAEDIFAAHYGNPPTPCSITGRGRHLVFQHPGTPVPCSTGKLGAKIDVRGDGGLIAAPPSLHFSGCVYAWDLANGMHPAYMAPAPLPEKLRLDISATARTAERTARNSIGERIAEGERDASLTRLAGALRRVGAGPQLLRTVLEAINREHVDPPLAAADLARIATSVARYAPAAAQPVAELAAQATARAGRYA